MNPQVKIRIFFGVEYGGGTFFTLDDPVKGVLDNVTYLLGTDDGLGIEVQTDAFAISVRRGRNRQLDEFDAGTCEISLFNFTRTFDAFNAAGIYYGDLVPGKRIEVDVWGQRIFAGVIEDWDLIWTVEGDATASITAEDALGQLARKSFDAWTTTAGQTAGPRLESLLGRPEIAFGYNLDLDVGVSTLQADNVTWGSNALNYAQLVVKSDQGRFFASRYNLLTFRDRHSLVSGATPSVAFTDDGTGVAFHGIGAEVGSEMLYNYVGVDREGGTLQTVYDQASMDAYGVRTLSLPGLLMDSDTQSRSMAEYLCYLYKDPTKRISEIVVKLHDDINLVEADRTVVAGLEIGDLIAETWTPGGVGDPVEGSYVVEGISHEVTPSGHVVEARLGSWAQSSVFILDDPVYGVLDTGPGLLSF